MCFGNINYSEICKSYPLGKNRRKYKNISEGTKSMKNQYLIGILESTKKRNPNEPEFIQALTEVLESLEPVIEKDLTL